VQENLSMQAPSDVVSPSTHPFERAGLGKAPFRCVGMSVEQYQAIPGDPSCPMQPGASCDYCGQGIMLVYRIQGVDGARFKVGCDCVRKTGDTRLVAQASDLERKHNRALAASRKAKKLASRAERNAVELADVLASLDELAGHPAVSQWGRGFAQDVAKRIRAGKMGALSTPQAQTLAKLRGEVGP